MIKNKQAIYKYNENYDYLPKELKNYFDGEITILIVDKSYRGKKIGKKLVTKIFELASNDNMKNLQILTDESCNYQFYEKLGCKKYMKRLFKMENQINVVIYLLKKGLYMKNYLKMLINNG